MYNNYNNNNNFKKTKKNKYKVTAIKKPKQYIVVNHLSNISIENYTFISQNNTESKLSSIYKGTILCDGEYLDGKTFFVENTIDIMSFLKGNLFDTISEFYVEFENVSFKSFLGMVKYYNDSLGLKVIIEKVKNSPILHQHYMTISQYISMIGVNKSNVEASNVGKNAKAICEELEIEVHKELDGKFGLVNAYPQIIIKELFNSNKYKNDKERTI